MHIYSAWPGIGIFGRLSVHGWQAEKMIDYVWPFDDLMSKLWMTLIDRLPFVLGRLRGVNFNE